MGAVNSSGDKAVLEYTAKFDGVASESLLVAPEELKAAWDALPDADKTAIETAKSNIEQFHLAQKPQDISVKTMKGVYCRREARAIGTAGL